MKTFLNDVLNIILIIFWFILAFIGTIFIMWPIIALVLVFCVLFWILLPIIGWIIFGILIFIILMYLIANLFN